MHHVRTHCVLCGAVALKQVLDLGMQPLANDFQPSQGLVQAEFPLRLFVCGVCWHVQLADIVDKRTLFTDYFYFSSANKPSTAHFWAYGRHILDDLTNDGDFVIEIGSNDGVLLSALRQEPRRILGVEPAANVARVARSRSVPTYVAFFDADSARQIAETLGQAKVITANNVLAHIEDVHSVVDGLRHLLAPDGTFVFEVPYLGDMLANLEFDTVYHEHISYFSLLALKRLLEMHDFKITSAKRFDIHGGTIRVYANHREHLCEPDAELESMYEAEKAQGLNSLAPLQEFADRVGQFRGELRRILLQAKRSGKSICGYGAPAKGSTLLNYCGIGPKLLDYCCDTTPGKQNMFTPGQQIPIYSPDYFKESPPDIALLLAWNYEKSIVAQEQPFIDQGGRFLVPFPAPHFV